MIAAFLWASPSQADHGAPNRCGPPDILIEAIQKSYREEIVHRGIRGVGDLLMVTVSAKRDWTVVMMTPEMACVIAWGNSWNQTVEEGSMVYTGSLTSGGNQGLFTLRVEESGSWALTFPGSENLESSKITGSDMETFWDRLLGTSE